MKMSCGWVILGLALGAAPVAAEESATWSTEGYVTAGTDYVWRGLSQTDGKAALQGEFGLYHASGFYGQAWAGRMDFGDPEDGIDYEVDLVLGWKTELGEHASLDVSFLRALFPGANPGYGINYSEWAVSLGFADHYSFAIAWSDDLYRLGDSAINYEFEADWPIGETPWGIKAAAGLYDLDRIVGDNYRYAHLGAYYNLGEDFSLDLGYFRTFGFREEFEEAIGTLDQADGRVVLELSWSF